MKHTYAQPLRDEDLRAHLERGDTVLFTEAVRAWKEIEHQVERLGFGDIYAVSRGTRPEPGGWQTHTRISPLRDYAHASAASPLARAISDAPRDSSIA